MLTLSMFMSVKLSSENKKESLETSILLRTLLYFKELKSDFEKSNTLFCGTGKEKISRVYLLEMGV